MNSAPENINRTEAPHGGGLCETTLLGPPRKSRQRGFQNSILCARQLYSRVDGRSQKRPPLPTRWRAPRRASLYICMKRLDISTCIQTYCTYIHTCIFTYIIHTYVNIYMYVYIYIYMYIHMYIHSHTYVNTYIHTYTYEVRSLRVGLQQLHLTSSTRHSPGESGEARAPEQHSRRNRTTR